MVREQTVAGMLLVGTADPEILSLFLERVPQIVLVDHRDPTGRHDCILSDGLAGGLPRQTIFLSWAMSGSRFSVMMTTAASFQDRLRGFVCAHFEAGRTVDPRLVVTAASEENPAVRPADTSGLAGAPDRLVRRQ